MDRVIDFKDLQLARKINNINDADERTEIEYQTQVILMSEFRERFGYDEAEELEKIEFEKAFIERVNQEYSWSTAFLVSLLIIYFITTSSGALYYLYCV